MDDTDCYILKKLTENSRPSLVALKYLLIVVFSTSNTKIIYNISGFV